VKVRALPEQRPEATGRRAVILDAAVTCPDPLRVLFGDVIMFSRSIQQVQIALAAPVFDPERQIDQRFFWYPERKISAGLTCNIGME
jgi:hypothetical protein